MKNYYFFSCIFLCLFKGYSQKQWQWALASDSGMASSSYANAMTYGGNDDIIVTGGFDKTLTIHAASYVSAGKQDCFVASLSKSGAVNWLRTSGGAEGDGGLTVCTDGDGNCYVAGLFYQSFTAGSTLLTNTVSNTSGIFLLKYDATGKQLWAKKMGHCSGTISHIKNRNGDLYLLGHFYPSTISPAVIGTQTVSPKGTNTNAELILARLDTAGNFISASQFGGGRDEIASGLSVTNAGEVVLAGSFASTVLTIGSFTLNGSLNNSPRVFIAKISAAGTVLWAKGLAQPSERTAVCTDASGNIGIAGRFASPHLVIGNFTLTGVGSSNGMLAKLDASGNTLWASAISGSGTTSYAGCTDIVFDTGGNLHAVGFFYSPSLTIGSHSLVSNQGRHLFIAKYNQSGSVTAVYQESTPNGGTEGYCILADPAGHVHTGGYFYGNNLIFGNHKIFGNTLTEAMWFVAQIGDPATGLFDADHADISLFPNPADEKIFIRTEGSLLKQVLLYDLSGTEIERIHIIGSDAAEISLKDLEQGVYILRVESVDGRVLLKKVIKPE